MVAGFMSRADQIQLQQNNQIQSLREKLDAANSTVVNNGSKAVDAVSGTPKKTVEEPHGPASEKLAGAIDDQANIVTANAEKSLGGAFSKGLGGLVRSFSQQRRKSKK